MKFSTYLYPILTGLVISNAAFSQTAHHKTFKVCADPLHPPYSDKTQKGFENKIASLFAKKLGQKVEYKWFPQRIGFVRNTLRAKLEKAEGYECDVIMGVPANYEMTANTMPYYHSNYQLLIAKGRGWDDITKAEQLGNLSYNRQQQLKMAMFDRGPGTTWLQQQDLMEYGIPYQTMTGDPENNTAMRIQKDLKSGKIDMVILWGPMAGYVLNNSPKGSYTAISMKSDIGMKFDFSIAMGVRYDDKAHLATLNRLIKENQTEINAILSEYQVPLLTIPAQKPRKDDD